LVVVVVIAVIAPLTYFQRLSWEILVSAVVYFLLSSDSVSVFSNIWFFLWSLWYCESVARTTSKVNWNVNAIIQGLPAPKPLGRFSEKNLQICKFVKFTNSATSPHTQVLGWIGSKGACLHMHEIVTLYVYFSLLYVSCASLQIYPLDRSLPLTAQMTRPCGIHVLYGSVNKNYFPIFHPEMWKIALHPTVNLKSYNLGIVEDTYKLFAPNLGFSGSANLMVSFKLTPDQPSLPW